MYIYMYINKYRFIYFSLCIYIIHILTLHQSWVLLILDLSFSVGLEQKESVACVVLEVCLIQTEQ